MRIVCKFLIHTRAYRGVEFELNQFADLSEDEFRRNVLMYPREAPKTNEHLVK